MNKQLEVWHSEAHRIYVNVETKCRSGQALSSALGEVAADAGTTVNNVRAHYHNWRQKLLDAVEICLRGSSDGGSHAEICRRVASELDTAPGSVLDAFYTDWRRSHRRSQSLSPGLLYQAGSDTSSQQYAIDLAELIDEQTIELLTDDDHALTIAVDEATSSTDGQPGRRLLALWDTAGAVLITGHITAYVQPDDATGEATRSTFSAAAPPMVRIYLPPATEPVGHLGFFQIQDTASTIRSRAWVER